METIEGNKLIAEFMGLIMRQASGTFGLDNWWEGDSNDGRKKGRFIGYTHQLEYHTSWDLLMPVWSKCIEVIGVYMHTHEDAHLSKLWLEKSGEISNFISAVDIHSSFHKISHLIQWYHNQTKTP